MPGPCPRCGFVISSPQLATLPSIPAATRANPVSEAVSRTQIGLVVLAVGVVLGVVSQIALLAGLAVFAGLGLLLSGRKPFGPRHARLVTAGFLLALLGSAGSAFLILTFSVAVRTPPSANADLVPWLQALSASFSRYLLAVVAFSGVSGIGYVLLTYALQGRVGRVLLGTGLGLSLAINLAVWYTISQEFQLLVDGVANRGVLDAGTLNAIFTHIQQFTLLSLIPACIYAGCFYLASDRIRSGAVTIAPTAIPLHAIAGGKR